MMVTSTKTSTLTMILMTISLLLLLLLLLTMLLLLLLFLLNCHDCIFTQNNISLLLSVYMETVEMRTTMVISMLLLLCLTLRVSGLDLVEWRSSEEQMTQKKIEVIFWTWNRNRIKRVEIRNAISKYPMVQICSISFSSNLKLCSVFSC